MLATHVLDEVHLVKAEGSCLVVGVSRRFWNSPRLVQRRAPFSGFPAIITSVEISKPAIEAASCKARRTTLVGSTIPALVKSPYWSIWASKP